MNKDFQYFLNTRKRSINKGLEQIVTSRSGKEFQSQIKHCLLSDGKRLRPVVILLTSRLFGGSQKRVMPLALSHELIHTASLVHDDIIDQEEYRRGQKSVQAKWGVDEAILTGNALISIAMELSSGYPPQIIRSLSRMTLQLSSGEKMELSARLGDYSQKRYLDSVRKKTGAMFVSCVSCPAWLGGASEKDISAIEAFGEHLGILFQIRDDILDITASDSTIPTDFAPPRITLPIIHAYRNTEEKFKEEFLHSWQKLGEPGSDSAYQKVRKFLAEKDSIAFSKKLKLRHARKALDHLQSLPHNQFRLYLQEMVSLLKKKGIDRDEKKLFGQH
ncbi:MAG: polyprenyl synthetase family protein [Candidatus Bipolaricaulota bacterium]